MRYRQVHTFVVGNEPNQPRFWQPQFVHGKAVAAAGYERMLADTYDALKAVDPTLTIVGGVVSRTVIVKEPKPTLPCESMAQLRSG